MYIISEVIEMGIAHEQILSLLKEWPTIDDIDPISLSPDDALDE